MFRIGLIVLATLLLLCSTLLADPPSAISDSETFIELKSVINFKVWAEEDGGNGHFYGILPLALTFEEATEVAKTLGDPGVMGYLATVTSFEENEFIFKEVIADLEQTSYIDQYWLGATYVDDSWQWLTGEAFIFDHWAPYEPNNIGVETVIAMWGPTNYVDLRRPGRWNNSLPNDTLNEFAICYPVIEWGTYDTTTVAPDSDTLINLIQWTEAEGGNDHWYGIIPMEMYWVDAKALATELVQDGMSGYLATILDADENQFILDQVIGDKAQPSLLDAYWLGGHDVGCIWEWASGEDFNYTNWALDEPNNEGIETVLAMWGAQSWKHNRLPGTWNNSLPDPSVNPLAQWWAVVEWGAYEPNTAVRDTLQNLTQWKKENGGNDHWYAVITVNSYADEAGPIAAQFEIDGEPGYLTTITSMQENDFVFDSVASVGEYDNCKEHFWLGGSYENGVASWNTGEPMPFEYWAAYQPSDYPGYGSMAMFGPDNWWESERPSMWFTAGNSTEVNFTHHWFALIEWGELDTTTFIPGPDTLMNLAQWPASEGGNGHYYAVMTTTEFWFQADARAHNINYNGQSGYLATVTTAEENEFILNNILANTNQQSIMDAFWMGAFEVDSVWQWITGEPFAYTNWAMYEPNNIGIENVAMMWGPNSWKINREPGTWNNSLPDDAIHDLAQWWSVIEWGAPDLASSTIYDNIPNNYAMNQNYPNPFNPTTIVSFSIPEAQTVMLEIYNITGQHVKTLFNDNLEAGHHQIEWDSRNQSGNPVASGIYFYRIKAGDFAKTKKMVLVR